VYAVTTSGNPENLEWKRSEKRLSGRSGNAVVRELVVAVLLIVINIGLPCKWRGRDASENDGQECDWFSIAGIRLGVTEVYTIHALRLLIQDE